MADVPTADDLFAVARREALVSKTRFSPEIIDTPGSDVNLVLKVGAAQGEEVAQYTQSGLNETSLSTARGEALRRYVYDQYQLTGKEPTSAAVVLRITRSNTDPLSIPAGSTFGTDAGQVYSTITDLPFGLNEVGPLDITAVAQQAGTAGNVAANTVTAVLSSLTDDSVAVTNPEPAAGGNEAESDDDLRDRARNFYVTARRGTAAAIAFGGQSVPRVAQAVATEALSEDTGVPGYRVFLSVADSQGQANLAIAQEVSASLSEYRALGVPVSVVPAIPQYENIIVDGLQFEAGSNTAEVLQSARNSLLAAINALPPKTTLRRNLIESVLGRVDQLIVPEGSIQEPLGDIVPSLGTIIRTRADLIILNGTTVQVASAFGVADIVTTGGTT